MKLGAIHKTVSLLVHGKGLPIIIQAWLISVKDNLWFCKSKKSVIVCVGATIGFCPLRMWRYWGSSFQRETIFLPIPTSSN